MTRLLKASPALATRFEELCGPLRHLLSQVVANSIGNITSRRDCAQHLVRLGSRSGAKLPKTDPQYIPYYYAWIYMLNLEHVKKVWQDTRGTRDPYLRRRQLEKIFYMLPLMSRTDAGKDAVDRFWCRCGNLLASPASDMAQHLTLFTLGLRLTPQRVREVLAKMNRRPSTGHQAPKVPPFPAFPIEFV
jgi:hypothetical protein